jgi:cytochrome b pre-mRNA-processing protein 3
MGKAMILQRIFAKKPEPTRLLYAAIVAAARQPKFYLEHGVADTVDGRFDMITLHMFLVLDRLRGQDAETEAFRQQLTEEFFLDMDRSLREMGVGDLSVGKKVRKMAEAFYGRLTAYAVACATGEHELRSAVARNVYADEASVHAAGLASWLSNAKQALATQDVAAVIAGRVQFP